MYLAGSVPLYNALGPFNPQPQQDGDDVMGVAWGRWGAWGWGLGVAGGTQQQQVLAWK